MQRARREEETPVHYPCNYGGVVRARPDYRETQRATSVRPIGGTSIKSRKPLIGVDVHARCRVESVRHVSSSRERRRPTSCFSRRARGDPDPASAVCLECVYAFSSLSYFIFSFFFFFPFCKVPRDRKRTIWNAAGCTAKRALITMTRSNQAAGILSAKLMIINASVEARLIRGRCRDYLSIAQCI